MVPRMFEAQERRRLHHFHQRCICDMEDDDEHSFPTEIKGEGAIAAYPLNTFIEMYSFSRHYQNLVCFEVPKQNVQILLMVWVTRITM